MVCMMGEESTDSYFCTIYIHFSGSYSSYI